MPQPRQTVRDIFEHRGVEAVVPEQDWILAGLLWLWLLWLLQEDSGKWKKLSITKG